MVEPAAEHLTPEPQRAFPSCQRLEEDFQSQGQKFPIRVNGENRNLWRSPLREVEDGVPKFLGRIGGELSVEEGRRATRLAALNALALVRDHLGSLDRVTRVVRIGVSLVTTPEFREHPKVADAASELLASVFGKDHTSTRLVFGMASLPVGVCVVLESIFEVKD